MQQSVLVFPKQEGKRTLSISSQNLLFAWAVASDASILSTYSMLATCEHMVDFK